MLRLRVLSPHLKQANLDLAMEISLRVWNSYGRTFGSGSKNGFLSTFDGIINSYQNMVNRLSRNLLDIESAIGTTFFPPEPPNMDRRKSFLDK